MFPNFYKLENLSSFKSETLLISSNRGTKGYFDLIIYGKLRMISFANIPAKNDYETVFPLPDWFCKNVKNINASCANGTGGAGGEVAEIYFEATTKNLKFYPATRSGYSGDLQLTGQLISFATD